MIVTEHQKPTKAQMRHAEFMWRLCAVSDFNKKLNKYIELQDNIERIKRLDLTRDDTQMSNLLKQHKQQVHDVLMHCLHFNLSAFHKDIAGPN